VQVLGEPVLSLGTAATETLQRDGAGWNVPLSGYEAVLISAK
jgi:hypothetical protein